MSSTSDIVAALGEWAERHEWTRQRAYELWEFLKAKGYPVAEPVSMAGSEAEDFQNAQGNDFHIQYRAKSDESIANKISRFGETLAEILDLYGIRHVVPDMETVEKVAHEIVEGFAETPTEVDMTLRGGSMVFLHFRDYRKRDWVGASPATAGGYTDAFHVNRKHEGRIFELQIMTRALFEKYCSSDSEESHEAFKKRQATLSAEA